MTERPFGSPALNISPRTARAEAFARFNPTIQPTRFDYDNPQPRRLEKRALTDMLREAVENTAKMQGRD